MKMIYQHPKSHRVNDLAFDDLYDEISSDWEGKARKLLNRRWRAMRREANRY